MLLTEARELVMVDKPHLDEEALAELQDVMENEFPDSDPDLSDRLKRANRG